MKKVFIDGREGTTGLRIFERLAGRDDISLSFLSGEDRKDPVCRKQALNGCDIAFLCLPDAAAREAVSMTENPDTVIIDTSTAHRTSDEWAYGFPELGNYEKIKSSKRISVPGCHACGFIALVAPLVCAGILSPDARLSCFSLTGYSGGGRKMIAEYESGERSSLLDAPRQYGLTQTHKHLPEMAKRSGLVKPPVFCPVVADYYSGMEVTVPLTDADTRATINDIEKCYADYYTHGAVHFNPSMADNENGFVGASALSGNDGMEIGVFGNDERFLLVSRFDNLGKGASGAAVQCLNILLGRDEFYGLEIK